MEPEGSLPHLQEPATCPCPWLRRSSSCSPTHFSKIHFNSILPSTPRSFKWSSYLSGFPTKTLYASLVSYPSNRNLLGLNTSVISGEEYRYVTVRYMECTFKRLSKVCCVASVPLRDMNLRFKSKITRYGDEMCGIYGL